MEKKKIVFVSGCFDMLHSGHIAFLSEAANFGNVHVGVGSDKTIRALKGRDTINSEQERQYMLKAIKSVSSVSVNSGSGFLDFEEELRSIKPDMMIVNEDGHSYEKETLCTELNIEYKVLKRIPHTNLPARSTTSIRKMNTMPYRIDLAGTWIDQPYVSKYHSGSAITASIEPSIEFNERSGMATSTRKSAIDLWNDHLPPDHPEKLAKMLFRFDNDPGNLEVSGSQDSIGITMPGVNYFFYEKGEYWPSKFESIHEEKILQWLESHISVITLWPRTADFDVLKNTFINKENVQALASASDGVWHSLKKMDLTGFSYHYLKSFEAQTKMFPGMLNDKITKVIDKYRDQAKAWKLSGAGGGGYLLLISDKEIEHSFKIRIRRKNSSF